MKKYSYDSDNKDFYDAPEGVYVLYDEAQAEIDELKKQVAELEEELEIQQSMGRY